MLQIGRKIIVGLLCFAAFAGAVRGELASADSELPFQPVTSPQTELPPTALIDTNKGRFEIEFLREQAPLTVQNFVSLVQRNFYDNVSFHYYQAGHVIQGGDPSGTGRGGPGYRLPPEFSAVRHTKGTLTMARLGGSMNPERFSNGSQFYICLRDSPQLDGLYNAFARVIRGLEVVDSLRKGDRIITVRLPKDWRGATEPTPQSRVVD